MLGALRENETTNKQLLQKFFFIHLFMNMQFSCMQNNMLINICSFLFLLKGRHKKTHQIHSYGKMERWEFAITTYFAQLFFFAYQ